MNTHFPNKTVLWRGAILGGIVNATMTAQDSSFAVFQNWWQQRHYIVTNIEGENGIVTFENGHSAAPGHLVGVFNSAGSDRGPVKDHEWNLERFFHGCPAQQRALANEAAIPHLQAVCPIAEGLEYHGTATYCVSAAFWDEGDSLKGADPWNILLANGISLLRIELIEGIEAALIEWQNQFGASPEQIAFARSLFEQKMAQPGATIKLTEAQLEFLESTFEDPRAKYEEIDRLGGYSARRQAPSSSPGAAAKWRESIDPKAEAEKAMNLCREQFAEIGILVPK